MDIRDKIVKALLEFIDVDFVRLVDDDGISGFVVSPQFETMSMLDRQRLIGDALSKASDPLKAKEKRHVLMVAGVTPLEYASVGARIRIQTVKQLAKGVLEIILHGDPADAEYVRRALDNQDGVQTTEPESVADAVGILKSFRVNGVGATPMTKAKAIRILKRDRYIQVLPGALNDRPGSKHAAAKKRSD
jgi:stress-induced morphogen